MASVQGIVYGHADCWGVPFDFYGTSLATGSTVVMQTGQLLVDAGGTLAALTVVLPLNPPDGAYAEIMSLFQITSLTIQANTGDSLVVGTLGTPTEIIPAASTTAGNASGKIVYRYSLNGDVIKGFAPRTWLRVQ